MAAPSLSRGLQTLSCGTGGLVPYLELNLGPLHWGLKDLATGPPGKSLSPLLFLMGWFSLLEKVLWKFLTSPILTLCWEDLGRPTSHPAVQKWSSD